MTKRLFSVVKGVRPGPQTRHYEGLPPELTDGVDSRRELPLADVLIMEEKPEGVFLYRYTEQGQFGGDTWHQKVDDAVAQSEFEFGLSPDDWKPIPEGVEDGVQIKQRSQS
jgi:hypothetical protein